MSYWYEFKYEPNKATFRFRSPEYKKAKKENNIELQKEIKSQFDELMDGVIDVMRAKQNNKNQDLEKH